MAGGLLDVTGKTRVKFELAASGIPGLGLSARVVARDGSEYPAVLEPGTGSGFQTLVADVAGASLVGVELSVERSSCPPNVLFSGTVRIFGIRGE